MILTSISGLLLKGVCNQIDPDSDVRFKVGLALGFFGGSNAQLHPEGRMDLDNGEGGIFQAGPIP